MKKMKKLFASIMLTGLALASVTPAFSIFMNRIQVWENCFIGTDRFGNPKFEMRTVDCLQGNGGPCGYNQCLQYWEP